MPSKLETSGYKRYWPLKEFVGKDMRGNKIAKEVYRDMITGQVYAPANGWDGSPPDLPSGERPAMSASDAYRENYKRIFGHE